MQALLGLWLEAVTEDEEIGEATKDHRVYRQYWSVAWFETFAKALATSLQRIEVRSCGCDRIAVD